MPEGLHFVGWPLLLACLLKLLGERAAPNLARRLGGRSSWWSARMSRRFDAACAAALVLSLLAIVAYAITAFLRPGYTEWVEKGVAAIGKNWSTGANTYPDASQIHGYGVYPYGPFLFQAIGAMALLGGKSDPVVKILPAALAVASYALLYAALRRAAVRIAVSLVLVALMAILSGIMGFMVKADIMLLLLATAACWLAATRPTAAATFPALCILAGLAAAIKFHGLCYIVPAIVETAAHWPRWSWRRALAGAALLVSVAMAPFLLPHTSLGNYLFVLRVAARDGLQAGMFVSNIAFIGTVALCVHTLTPAPQRDPPYWRMLYSVLGAGCAVSVFAAKAEAGWHHLIPFMPFLLLLLGRSLSAPAAPRKMQRWARVLLVLFLVSFQPVTGVIGDIGRMRAHWTDRTALW